MCVILNNIIFEDIKILEEPIKMKGHLGLWNFELSENQHE